MDDLGQQIKEARAKRRRLASTSKDEVVEEQQEQVLQQEQAEPSHYSLPSQIRAELLLQDEQEGRTDTDPFADTRRKTIAEREDDYHSQRFNRVHSSEVDTHTHTNSTTNTSYKQAMISRRLEREEESLRRIVESSIREREDDTSSGTSNSNSNSNSSSSKWDATPIAKAKGTQSSGWDMTPQMISSSGSNSSSSTNVSHLAMANMTPEQYTSFKSSGGITSTTSTTNININTNTNTNDLSYRNRPLSDTELNAILPTKGYEIVLPPSSTSTSTSTITTNSSYIPPSSSSTDICTTDIGIDNNLTITSDVHLQDPELPFTKPHDYLFFGSLLNKDTTPNSNSKDKATIRSQEILLLLLQIKNGSPPIRKQALRLIIQDAPRYGPKALFDHILPLLMSTSLEDQERHLLVKVVGRLLYRLDHLVRPFTHRLLVVVEPLLIDEDMYARAEGRQLIANLSKAVGFPCVIAALRPNIDSEDEYVRNTTCRALAVVGATLGIGTLLPFLKAVASSRKSWLARHSAGKVVQQLAILVGGGVLAYLVPLVGILGRGLADKQSKVRSISALGVSSLAEGCSPFGGNVFTQAGVVDILWEGVYRYRGKGLSSYLKAAGGLLPLMEEEQVVYYSKALLEVLVREMKSVDVHMVGTCLWVVDRMSSCPGVDREWVLEEIVPPFLDCFWTRRVALDKKTSGRVVGVTLAIAGKVGETHLLAEIAKGLSDESIPLRKMSGIAIQGLLKSFKEVRKGLGVDLDLDYSSGSNSKTRKSKLRLRLTQRLVEGLLTSLQDPQDTNPSCYIASLSLLLNPPSLLSPSLLDQYLPSIAGLVKHRLSHTSPSIRAQTCTLIAQLSPSFGNTGTGTGTGTSTHLPLLSHLSLILYESLSEEYPETLSSILLALSSILRVVKAERMTPSLRDLLPRLTPILKNRHPLVQEQVVALVGGIAEQGGEYVSPREWLRVCFELLDLLKAQQKGVRRATINTIGHIAKCIGPQDVLGTLLTNLRVQERQQRVCTTIAIAIVAESCSPFTVLPALINEYRLPELNVQNGVLKALSFLFEYIGEGGKDYVYAVIPLLEDALMDRDAVHRQTACVVVKHLALGLSGLGCEDGLLHLLNYVFPNILETSPHVINAVVEAIEALCVGVGCCHVVGYLLQGLYHPARTIRGMYWRMWNTAYVGYQDAMVPCYPRVPGDGFNAYERWEMEYFL